jgi:methylmalonyl-CoA mutase N-terminal domain/subunit
MFEKAVLDEAQAISRKWEGDRTERYDGKEFAPAKTESGIPLKPFYSPQDIENIDFGEIGLPGEYPYTRGIELLPRRVEPWVMRMHFGHGEPEVLKKRYEYLQAAGMAHRVGEDPQKSRPNYFYACDIVSQQGLDPDDPEAEGRVGYGGSTFCTLDDCARAFDGLELAGLRVQPGSFDTEMITVAMFMVYAERRGYQWDQLMIGTSNVAYRQYWWDTISFPPDKAKKIMAEQIYNTLKRIPLLSFHTNIDGYNLAESGANVIQELAFSLSLAVDVMEECVKAGLDPDEVAAKFYHHATINLNFLEQIAKFRALRRMWAKLFKERLGCKKPQSLQVVTFPQNGGSCLTAQEPLNNIVRTTLQTLIGVLAGVDGIWTACYDEALNTPADEPQKMAVRLQQIIYHETDIPDVGDVFGGSYCIESLTSEIEKKGWALFEEIERQGGAFECWKNGYFQSEMIKGFNDRQKSINSGEKVMVGVNKYPAPRERGLMLEISPEIEKRARERVAEYRARRNKAKYEAGIVRLRQATKEWDEQWPGSCGSLLPAIIDAVRVQATLGEIHAVLREVLGHGYCY